MLGVAAMLQLAITDPVALPAPGPIGVGSPLPVVRDPPPRGVPGAILSRPLFAPPLTGGAAAGEDGAAAADPLEGATILGTVAVGRARYAVVQVGGATRRVAIGGTVAGWRLLALGADTAVLGRGRERLRRSYGSGTVTDGTDAGQADASSEDQE